MTWIRTATDQHGVVTREQLRDHGKNDLAITRLVHSKHLWRLHEGVFMVRGAPLTHVARAWAAVLLTGGVLGFETAAYLWQHTIRRPARIDVCVDHPVRSHSPEWLLLHRVRVPE